jgi:hypothetical protein
VTIDKGHDRPIFYRRKDGQIVARRFDLHAADRVARTIKRILGPQ